MTSAVKKRSQDTAAPDHQRPFPLIKKEWYQWRGKLATKKHCRGKGKHTQGAFIQRKQEN